MSNGLSQIERRQRIESLKPFAVTESNIQSLLRQSGTIADMIRYVDSKGEYAGYFDDLLNELKTIREYDIIPDFSGNMEPSQALLYSFLDHLHKILQAFNDRWKTFHHHYFNNILQVASQEPKADKTWISFVKDIPGDIELLPGTRFTHDNANPQNKIYYCLTEKMVVTDAIIDQAYSLHFVKNAEIYPANSLDVPVVLKTINLLTDKLTNRMLFDETGNPEISHPLGIQISSPSLLLREGVRSVSLSFKTENVSSFDNIQNKLLKHVQENDASLTDEEAYRLLTNKLLKNIFYLEISTSTGWEKIISTNVNTISLKYKENKNAQDFLVISFELPDDFPATTACNLSGHQIETRFPTLRILLNHDSWLYPYCWIKDLNIVKLEIKINVSGISNISFYNELGKVDNSTPFSPFGINTEQGSYFTIGNYEMALKNVERADVLIQWQQLPENKGGLSDYYNEYNQAIDNCSFKLQPQYLANYKWKIASAQKSVFLFSTKTKSQNGNTMPDRQLSDESLLSQIDLTEMKPLMVSMVSEEEYDYNILSESGFFRFILEEPKMGFGEKQYRALFPEQIIKRALKKSKTKLLNPPITPLIERVTLSYSSVDVIDMRKKNNCYSTLSHIYPLGQIPVHPNKNNGPIPFLYSLDTDANILLGLKNIKGNETIRFYFDFLAQDGAKDSVEMPTVQWYWGNGHHWVKLPDDSVYKDTTKNFFNSGQINIYLPEISNENLRDKNGLVWLRAGIVDKKENISGINQIKTNVAEVYRDKKFVTNILDKKFVLNTSEINIPKISKIEQMAPFSEGITEENKVCKMIRISEHVSHRGKAVTARDYERIVLNAFPDVSKVKCLCNYDAKVFEEKPGKIILVVAPVISDIALSSQPRIPSARLLQIKDYLKHRTSINVKEIDVINPVYEQILVRCELHFDKVNYPEISDAVIRTDIRESVNKLIAPWQYTGGTPMFGHSFRIDQLYLQIEQIHQVKDIKSLSVVQVYIDKDGKYNIQEYTKSTEIVFPKFRQTILVPAQNHTIVVLEPDNAEGAVEFGINEMEINENFIICRQKIEKH